MRILKIFLFISFILLSDHYCPVIASGHTGSKAIQPQEQEIPENQILYNGRIWRNEYSQIKGDQFLFSQEYNPGKVTISGKLFDNIELRYDIYNDELITKTRQGIILQLNKEMVNAFSMEVNDKSYDFIKLNEDSLNNERGYVNVLYNNYLGLIVKYKKEILLLAVDKKYDAFFQYHRIYVMKNGKVYLINKKNDVLKLFPENKQEIKGFIKSNKLAVTKKNPESFIPVIEFIDKLNF